LHSLVSSLKQEMTKQKIEYESRIKRWGNSQGHNCQWEDKSLLL
jgi:hypothetical protein